MNEHLLGYREVIPDQTIPEKWQEIKLNTGGTQSTLQDIKMAERAGGYCYKDSSNFHTRNRFIYWRSSHDVLELVELSLDVNLSGNHLRLKFINSPLLEGITIHESNGSVVLLVATVSSVHRLAFPHPDIIHKQDKFIFHSDINVPSIFNEANHSHNCHVLTTPNSPLPHSAATWLSNNGYQSLYALAYTTGSVICISMDNTNGLITTIEIKPDSFVPKFISTLTGVLRGRNSESQACTSMVLHSIGSEPYLFALCRDGNLRMWSTRKGNYITSSNIIGDSLEGKSLLQGAQGHILRKTVDNTDSVLLAAFLCFATESQFVIVKPTHDSQGFKFVKVYLLYVPQQDLVDFSLSHSHIWALWSNSQGEASVTSALLNCSTDLVIKWIPAALETGLERDCVTTEPGTDPRQAYCAFIFHPGQFQLSVITRALSIYSRQPALGDISLSAAVLREKVCLAVETEIQLEAQNFEINDDEYLEIANRCWGRFYSCCLQYHLSGSRPVGLVQLETCGGVTLVRKSLISLIRPMDTLEHLVLCGEYSTPQHFSLTPQLAQESSCEDLITLINTLVSLEHQLPEEIKCNIEKQLYQLNLPDDIMVNLLPELLGGGDDAILSPSFLNQLWQSVEPVRNLYQVIQLLLEILRMDHGQPHLMHASEDHINPKDFLAVEHMYGSRLGLSTVAESLRQIAAIRFSICRNLLLLQHLLLNSWNNSNAMVESIRSVCGPDTVVFLQAYYVMMWLCETPANPMLPANMLESSLLRLASLHLSNNRQTSLSSLRRTTSLLELFLHGPGSGHALKLLGQRSKTIYGDRLPFWHLSMVPYVTLLGQMVWAVSGNFLFGEWLVGSGQHLLLHEYVRLLREWCEWNTCSRQFILAVSLLDTGEPHKALDYFILAARGVHSEPFLITKMLPEGPSSSSRDNVLYYLKVLKLFEEHSAADCVISLAQTAINMAPLNDNHIPFFQSIIFKKHLILEHFEEAYHSLSCNPDSDRRKDCLRELVSVLFSKKRLDLLLTFPYVDFYEDFQKIVEGRARAADIMSTNYYNFLYSFYVEKSNMRKAASIMYEQAFRLGLECKGSIESLTKQSRCLLAALNALHLVQPKYSWLIQPATVNDEVNSSKRDNAGDVITRYKKQVEVVQIEDIQKDLEIVNARLKLAKHSSELQSIVGAGPHELIGCLSSVGLFTTAISLCKSHNISLVIPIENLAGVCVRLSQQDDQDAWNWLVNNDLSDLGIGEKDVSIVAWRLLQILIEKYEEMDSTELRRAVTKRILSLGAFLPNWLLSSYKRTNTSELLRLLTNSGRLLEAAELCKELLWAALGRGYEIFGLKTSLMANSPALCIPITTIDILLHELKQLMNEETYNQCYKELNEVVEYYIENIRRVSNDMEHIRIYSA